MSDVDLYAFSNTELELPVDETAESWRSTDQSGVSYGNWIGRFGDVLVDLKTWPMDAVSRLLAPYLGPEEPEFCDLSENMSDFVYRMSMAVPLKNEEFFAQARRLIERSAFGRSRARGVKTLAENRLIDVAGQLASGDVMSARLTATQVAFMAADFSLILAGQLCNRPKWLMRRLQDTPECGITVEEYRNTVLDGPRDGEPEADYALRVARWAQAQLVRGEPKALGFA